MYNIKFFESLNSFLTLFDKTFKFNAFKSSWTVFAIADTAIEDIS